MKKLLVIVLLTVVYACIPLQVAPNIETDTVKLSKKFKKDLPRSYGFIFEDPKEANEFYNFINTKYNREHIDVEYNVPISIKNKTYYLSFHEREKNTTFLNLVPLTVYAKLQSEGKSTLMDGYHTTRTGHWYLILTVYDDDLQDCLKPEYPEREAVLTHLRMLQKEYMTTSNYLDSYLSHQN
ncbi:hypothetical protein [Hanstruepera neustonica]|nr:hypothetical protein [Hanstruepera neustonica]